MEKIEINLKSSGIFSQLFLDYVSEKKELKNFIIDFPTIENVKKNISNFAFSYLDRKTISQELIEQNKFISVSKLTQKNINSLANNNSFTVCTGHQLCLFTGPAFFIYKIISCIKTCEILNKEMPDYNFVPVYWMASEDHDLKEIDHSFVFGKQLSWEIKGEGRAGDLALDGITKLIFDLAKLLGESENSRKIISLFEKAYAENHNLSQAMRILVNEIFGIYGLVILDGNSSVLKKLFINEMKHEVIESSSFNEVMQSSKALKDLGYITQVTPREINLFYAKKNSRERIVKDGNNFKVLNSQKIFTELEILTEIETNPYDFSPNVVLRPLYQQKILPNIIYCGGPGEIAYWLQYKSFFDNSKIHFPFLLSRNFVLILDKQLMHKWKGLGFLEDDLFLKLDVLSKKLVKFKSGEISMLEKRKKIEAIFEEIINEYSQTDKSIIAFLSAEKQKSINSISVIEAKLNKALKLKNEICINQTNSILSKIFPAGIFQERHESFFSFCNQYGLNILDTIKNEIPSPLSGVVVSIIVL